MKNKIISILLTILAFAILFGFFWPIFSWYYKTFPPLGADFYQYTTYVQYFKEHFTLPILSWKYIWFDGLPTFSDYAWLFFYLGVPFAKIWGLTTGAKLFLISMLFFYGIFSYFLLKELSKSRLFALAGAVALLWTLNLYDALMSGGNTTYSSTQVFLPIGLWLLVKYYKNFDKKYLYLLILATGISYAGHPGTGLLFIWFPLLIIFALWSNEQVPLFSFKKIKETLYFAIFSLGIGSFALYSVAYLVLTIPKLADFSLTGKFKRIHPPAIVGLFTTQNIFLYAAFFLLLLLVILHKYFKDLQKLAPFIGATFYMLFFEWLYVIGRNPFGGALFPSRTYWVFGLLLACMTAILYQLWCQRIGELLKNNFQKMVICGFKIILFLILILAPIGAYANLNERIFGVDQRKLGVALNLLEYYFPALTILGTTPLDTTIDNLIAKKNLREADKNELKGKLLPEWLDPDELNFRLHTLVVGINTWWNSIFNMPLSHGAYSSRLLNTQNYAYWTDTAIHGELTAHWKVPLKVAKNQLLFLIDWRAIRYLYGMDFEITEETPYDLNSKVPWALTVGSYLTKDKNVIDRKGLKDIPIEKLTEEEKKSEDVTFFRVKKEATSPIIKTTKAPTILVVGDKIAYDDFVRNLGTLNLNSRYVIPIEGPKSLKKLSFGRLKDFDLVLLNRYESNPKGWKILEEYVKEGGNLIIETNSDRVKESDSRTFQGNKELPAIFPISKTVRGSLGKKWNLNSGESLLLKGIDFSKFGPLEYDGGPWNLSYTNKESLRNWGEVILSQQDQPILVSGNFGRGKVVWSGMNLFYHINRNNNLEEANFLKNILGAMILLQDEGTLDFKMERPKPEKISVRGENFTGVVFKENNYGGWKARLISPNRKSLKVYQAGLGYSYVKIPEGINFPAEVEFYFVGSFKNWLMFILSTLLIIWLLIKIFFEKQLIKSPKFKISAKYKAKVRQWWEREDE